MGPYVRRTKLLWGLMTVGQERQHLSLGGRFRSLWRMGESTYRRLVRCSIARQAHETLEEDRARCRWLACLVAACAGESRKSSGGERASDVLGGTGGVAECLLRLPLERDALALVQSRGAGIVAYRARCSRRQGTSQLLRVGRDAGEKALAPFERNSRHREDGRDAALVLYTSASGSSDVSGAEATDRRLGRRHACDRSGESLVAGSVAWESGA